MQEAAATDANTVVIKFKVPAPRFFYFMTYKYDIGVYIVPKHIFEGQDWTTFKHFDLGQGLAGHHRPLEGGRSPRPEQKIIDRARRLVGGQGRPGAAARRSSASSGCPSPASSRSPRR